MRTQGQFIKGEAPSLVLQHLPVPVRGKRRLSRRIAAVLLVVLVGAGGAGYYVWKQMHPPLPVGITYGNGRIEADEVDIDTKYAGRVSELLADIGDIVSPGRVIARMDTRDIEQSLSKSEAEARQAQKAIDEAQANLVQQQTQQTLAIGVASLIGDAPVGQLALVQLNDIGDGLRGFGIVEGWTASQAIPRQ